MVNIIILLIISVDLKTKSFKTNNHTNAHLKDKKQEHVQLSIIKMKILHSGNPTLPHIYKFYVIRREAFI